MNPKYAGLVGVVIAQSLASIASAQCSGPVQIAVVTTGTFTQSCAQDPVTTRWNVNITLAGTPTSNSTVTIRGASDLMLGRVVIQNNTAIDCRVNILGSGFDQRIGGVGYIDRGTSGPNRVLLLQLNTNGDVGYDRPGAAAINVDMIYNLSVGGSVLGDMVSQGTSRTMGNIYIQGDLAGGISLAPTSSLASLWVGGALGRPTDPPVQVSVSGNILNLTAGSINADINALANSAAGTVHALETTSGPFRGSLTCHRMGFMTGGSGPQHFTVTGDLDASLTVTRDIRVPVHVTGSFNAARPGPGGTVANIISAGTGAFDDSTADPAWTFAVDGDFNGSMVLGTPLTAGFASLNRNLIVGGRVGGSISMAQDVGADISILGAAGMSGGMVVDGSLRSGRSVVFNGPITSTGLLSFGGSLSGGLSLPSGGLQGQVIVNARNAGGTWSGPVSVGGANPFIGAPFYSTTSGIVGGGAIGLVPFRANLLDCTPAHNTNSAAGMVAPTAFTPGAPAPVMMRLYGPVQSPPGFTVSQTVAVEQLVGASWVDRSSYFTIDFVPSGVTSSRTIGLTRNPAAPGNPPAGQYRMRPLSLQCGGVTGSPGVVWTDPYLFRIDTDCDNNGQADSVQLAANSALDQNHDGVLDSCQTPPPPTCPCDSDQSGTVTIQDLFTFLGQFFAGAPQGDFDHSGTISVQDVFSFLACFFDRPAGC